MEARAYWTVEPGRGEIRTETLTPPGRGEALVRTTRSGISRGTETLVHRGGVPESVRELMRAPFQAGELPGAVKYGYLSVGVVEAVGAVDTGGADGQSGAVDQAGELVGRRVFCLYPHQDRYVVPTSALTPIPDDVPDDRALLAGAVETALNALWDAAPRYGDRVAVVGAGMIGACAAALLRRFPLGRLELIDPDPARQAVADALGVRLVAPQDAAGDCDVVLHASATAAGLAGALALAGTEAEVMELSWYGDRLPEVPLGEAFHAKRLVLRASQVGAVAAARRARRTMRDRLALALGELADPAYDVLLTGRCPFVELPARMDDIAQGRWPGLAHVVIYP